MSFSLFCVFAFFSILELIILDFLTSLFLFDLSLFRGHYLHWSMLDFSFNFYIAQKFKATFSKIGNNVFVQLLCNFRESLQSQMCKNMSTLFCDFFWVICKKYFDWWLILSCVLIYFLLGTFFEHLNCAVSL